MTEEGEIEAGIAALESQRGVLSDAVLAMALGPLHARLDALRAKQRAASQQLRQVTVLFVDVVGSTAMGQQLEPEDIHAVMDGALVRFTAVVESHRGRVLQYTGDGMLAAFGADAAQEDDAESAIRAGLAIIQESRRLAPAMRERHGIPEFSVRAGIHTGSVLLGGGVDAEGSIRGAAVNIAARMEQAAPAGGLRISHDTYRQVRGVFDVAEQPPIAVKGVGTPMRTYLIERAKPRAFRVANRGIEGVETRMVGRDAELAALCQAFAEMSASGSLRAISIVGEAGIGKSRMLTEFQNDMETHSQRFWLLLGRSHPRSEMQPHGLLRDVLAWRMQIADSDSAEQARAKLLSGLAPLFVEEGEAPAHFLGQLIGLDFSASPHVKPLLTDTACIRELAFEAAAHFIRRLASSGGLPVVLLLDDLHWADEGSVAFVRHLLARNRDMPLLVLMLTRPVLFERHPDWATGDPLHTRIDLAPLDKAKGQELAEVLLQRVDDVRSTLLTLITASADGNPFYMEEMVKMLLDDGVIEPGDSGWHVEPKKLLKLRVPPTLTGVIQARMDALAPVERSALQHAAVVGHVFWDQALAALDPAAPEALPALLRKQLVVLRDAPAFDGTREYAFHHHLLQQVVYEGVLKERRRSGHAKVGAFWGARAGVAEPQDVSPASCRALAEAHHHLSQSDTAACAQWFDGQFFNYLNAYALHTLRPLAQDLVRLCETHLGADHPETAKALTNLARVALVQGEADAAEVLLRRALAIQEAALGPEHADTAKSVAVLGGCFVGRGELVPAEQFFRRALAIREKALGPEHPLTVDTLDHLTSVVTELGRLDEAEPLSRRVLEHRERTLGPDHASTALAMTSLGDVLTKKGDYAGAETLVRRAIEVQQRQFAADHPETGLSMWNLAEILRATARHGEAEALARQALDMWESSLGADHQWAAWGLATLAELRLAQQDAAQAAHLAERSLRIHERAFGLDHEVVASTLFLMARALVAQADAAGAQPLLDRALRIQGQRGAGEAAETAAMRELLASVLAVSRITV